MGRPKKQKWWLFYSKRCPHSTKFIELASKHPEIASKISQVEVEVNKDRLPPWLKSVPTLQMDEEIISGPKLLEWIDKQTKKDLEPSPLSGSLGGGFDLNPYSSLNGTNDSFKGFSNIGSKNGSEGMDESQFENANNKSMDQMQADRASDIRGLMG